ncbi:MAG: twin-arginine translocation signal domain-containing protein, partial [Deltaproteobacteria bacterium]
MKKWIVRVGSHTVPCEEEAKATTGTIEQGECMKPISRRKFLKTSAAMAAGYGLLSGFKGRPDRARPDVPIDTIVILMMENRSFDQMFGSLSLEEGRSDV